MVVKVQIRRFMLHGIVQYTKRGMSAIQKFASKPPPLGQSLQALGLFSRCDDRFNLGDGLDDVSGNLRDGLALG